MKGTNNQSYFSIFNVLFFICIFYLGIRAVVFMFTPSIGHVQVKEGGLSNNFFYTGLAIRSGKIYKANNSGYINYLVSNGKRVGYNDTVATIDSSGSLYENAVDNKKFDYYDVLKMRNLIYDNNDTNSDNIEKNIYELNAKVNGLISEVKNHSIINNIKKLSNKGNIDINYCKAKKDGYFSNYLDGDENLKIEKLSKKDFDEVSSNVTNYSNNSMVEKNSPIYKIIDSEQWELAINLNKEDYELFQKSFKDENKDVRLRFLDDGDMVTATARLDKIKGLYLMRLLMNNSVLRHIDSRFLDIELMINKNIGFKIPNSAITEKLFYKIPKDYLTKGGDLLENGVIINDENKGNKFISVDNIKWIDDKLYISTPDIKDGVVLINPNNNEHFVISKSKSFKGVYMINKGYARFVVIDILDSNDRFSIVNSNNSVLEEYDYIVSEAKDVNDNDIVSLKE